MGRRLKKFFIYSDRNRNPKLVYLPKDSEELMQEKEPGQDERELIEEIFDELKDRLCYLEIHPQPGGHLSEGDQVFNEAVVVFDDLLNELEAEKLAEYGGNEDLEEEELDE